MTTRGFGWPFGGWLLAAALCAGCPTETDPLPAFRHQALYAHLQQCAERFSLVAGDWKEDFGDAAFYGPAFYARAGRTEADQAWLERAEEAFQRNLRLIQEQDLVTGDVNEIAMSVLGMIETMAASGDRSQLGPVNAVLDDLIGLVEMLGGYLTPALVPGYAMETYGPVSINGLVGLVFAQHAALLGDENRERYTQFAGQIAARIRAEAWNRTHYEFGLGRTNLHLYPNLTMILLHLRLYQLTADSVQLDRALQVFAGIEPLRVETDSGLVGPGRYFSPYSAEYMGAQTADYTTLSSQNYLLFALLLLFEATGERAFLEEIDPILDFLDEYLDGIWCLAHIHKNPSLCDPACDPTDVCVDGACTADSCQSGILHHWMDGRLALPEDPEFFCSGCNLQLLYVLWYRQEMLR